jgi:protein subunit release factor B
MKTILQITAGLAPEEALRFVDLLARDIKKLAKHGARVTRPSTKRSMAQLEFTQMRDTTRSQIFDLQGTHLLHSDSRGRGGRKRWFIGVLVWDETQSRTLREEDVRFEYCRAGGPGGQHVNRTSSAVRATHSPTGISVRIQGTRSQHQNKHEALSVLSSKYKECIDEGRGKVLSTMRRTGFAFERGNPVREYVLERGRLRALLQHERTTHAK